MQDPQAYLIKYQNLTLTYKPILTQPYVNKFNWLGAEIPLRQFSDGYACAFFSERSQLLKH